MNKLELDRDELASAYLDQLPYEPYPVQEEALLAWFTSEQGVLVCAPTGTGKTLIAEAALFEALHRKQRAYYTTPLIALTEQKYREIQESAVRWGFSADDVGLVTGNRRVNPDANVLIVVAEILFNRLLHPEAFDFADVSAVVMDEFHSFNDPERGIVWEFSLGLLPASVRTLLLSATIGSAYDFVSWLERTHDRKLQLVQSDERKVPLEFAWISDQLLNEQVEHMADSDEANRRTPALVFCFNREQCWSIAEQLKGKSMLADGQQRILAEELQAYQWNEGAGPKLKQILMRGIGVHHAGLLPRYKRIVEDLFQRKLLTVTVCTETLAAGVNLPARSVVIPNLLKGPPDNKRLIDASSAHQMFGRAGRPQFDTKGYVFALAHEDDVRILRWKEKYDQIPEDTKDPQLRKAKKALKKKKPTRRENQQYWSEAQFVKLQTTRPAKLRSTGPLPWRLLAHILEASPEIQPIRDLVGKRLFEGKRLERAQLELNDMLVTLWTAGYVVLDPTPTVANNEETDNANPLDSYKPDRAHPTENLEKLQQLRGVNPLYGVFVINQLGIADRAERLQAMESILDLPASVGKFVRVPHQDQMTPGPLATTRLDIQLLKLGLATPEEITGTPEEEQEERGFWDEERVFVLKLAEKLLRLFGYDFPRVEVRTFPAWVVGELFEFGGEFNKYIVSKGLQKQEGVIFRHLLRMILLVEEFLQFVPPDTTEEDWKTDLTDIKERIVHSCRRVDPLSTDKTLEQAVSHES